MEKIKCLANNLADKDINVVVNLWNSYLKGLEEQGKKNRYHFYIHDMKNIEEDMRELVQKRSYLYILEHVNSSDGHFKTYEKFWYENDVDQFISFDLLNDYYCPIDFEELAEYIAITNPRFFTADIMDIIDEFLYAYVGEDDDLTKKYLTIINENIRKDRFITDDWDVIWIEISQNS